MSPPFLSSFYTFDLMPACKFDLMPACIFDLVQRPPALSVFLNFVTVSGKLIKYVILELTLQLRISNWLKYSAQMTKYQLLN